MNDSCIIVFPSVFSINRLKILITNIKKILKLHEQKYEKIIAEDEIIIIYANDPVFASSIINHLFGINKIAIAKKNKKDDKLNDKIAKIGYNMLLNNEKFYVKIEGETKSYCKDAEIIITSKIIENAKNTNIRPGFEDSYDKLVYTYITSADAYTCIYIDNGNYGLPYNVNKEGIFCCIYDELSALICLESIKAGFDINIIICYQNQKMLLKLAKILNHMLPKILKNRIEVEFIKIDNNKNFSIILKIILDILIRSAKNKNIKRIAIPISSFIFSVKLIDHIIEYVYSNNIIPLIFSLSDIIDHKTEIDYDTIIKKLQKIKISNILNFNNKNKIDSILENKKNIIIKNSKNNIHNILDLIKDQT